MTLNDMMDKMDGNTEVDAQIAKEFLDLCRQDVY